MPLAFNPGDGLGDHYRGGAFLAFHGSWNRAPLPQAGFRVVYIPFDKGRPSGRYETFATGSQGPTSLRASGVAVGPDGALYIADDHAGRIWRVTRSS
jgi:glucose/arabinose dehydrogenase